MPLIESQIDALANIYAGALIDMAKAQGGQAAIEETLGEIEDMLELARADKKFSEFLSSRIISPGDREKSLRAMFTGKVRPMTLDFLLVLNSKGRLSHLPAIVAAFDEHVQKTFGRIECDVTTAHPMTDAESQAIAAKLRQVLGKEPVLHAYVDPALIGGVRVQIGDQLIDGSVSARLRQMRDSLATNGSSIVRAKAERIFNESTNGKA